MDIIVDTHELEHATDVITKDASDLNDCIDNLCNQVEILKTIWQGQDADKFCSNIGGFLKEFKRVPNSMDRLGRLAIKANIDIQNEDDAFSKGLEKEAIEDEQQDYNN